MKSQKPIRTSWKLLIAVLVAVITVACGTNAQDDASESITGADYKAKSKSSLEDKLPKKYQDKGTIVWGTEPYYPPFKMPSESDDNKLVGIDVELAKEMSALLGVKPEFKKGKFDTMIPGIKSARYDAFIDAAADTPERRQEVNFVDYFQSGSTIFVKPGNPENITEMENLCGKTVGAVKGSFQVNDGKEQRDKCSENNNKELDLKVYPDEDGMILALASGRTDAMLMDNSAGRYAAEQSDGKFEPTDSLTHPKRKGIVIAKDNEELMEAIQLAMQELMDNGTYEEILERWDQETGAIDKATINDGEDD